MSNVVKISAGLVSMILLMSYVMQTPEPWKQEQLMKPEALAKLLSDEDKANDPVIFNIGPAGAIKGSIEIGFVNESKGIKKLEASLKNVPKDNAIVLYCGCCPFEHCPNIRPAFTLLTKKGFKNHRLLDLPKNLKVDWIDKGYPMEE